MLTPTFLSARADEFFRAWRAGDLDAARRFVSPDFDAPLEAFTPTEEPHTCTLELDTTGQMTCLAQVEEGPWGIYVVFDTYGAGTTPRNMYVQMIGPDDVG